MNEGNCISLKKITKSFAGVKALDDVSLDIVAGKVHGLIGANGAGKSTLIKVLAGVYQADHGEIVVDGKKVLITDPSVASSLGLSFIHQELHLVQNFSVAENLTLGLKKDTTAGLINWATTTKKLEHVLSVVGFNKSINTPVKNLSVADQWLIAIARALYQNVKYISMDEPTAALSESEVQTLFSIVRDLTKQGIGVIYVSHRLDEVMELCDEITVFKDGQKVMHEEIQNLTKDEIITAIAGHKVEVLATTKYTFKDKPDILKINNLVDEKKVKGISFVLKQGEVLGITGLVGSGRTETAMAIFGDNKIKSGTMEFEGKPFAPKQPYDAVKEGIVIVPEERRTEGLITSQTLNFNINIPTLNVLRNIKALPFISMKKSKDIAKEAINKLLIKTSSVDESVLNLSGGNQQKVVIGKWLKRHPKLIIMDEPTQGVDVGARSEIYKLIRNMAREGVSFLIISSDMDEIPGLCDRVLVMSNGKLTGELTGEHIVKESMLRLCYSDATNELKNE